MQLKWECFRFERMSITSVGCNNNSFVLLHILMLNKTVSERLILQYWYTPEIFAISLNRCVSTLHLTSFSDFKNAYEAIVFLKELARLVVSIIWESPAPLFYSQNGFPERKLGWGFLLNSGRSKSVLWRLIFTSLDRICCQVSDTRLYIDSNCLVCHFHLKSR